MTDFITALSGMDDAAAAAAVLTRAEWVCVASIGLDGRPQARRVRLGFCEGGALWFCLKKSERLYAEISLKPLVRLCAWDAQTGTELRLSGSACFSEEKTILARCVADDAQEAAEHAREPEMRIAFCLSAVTGELLAPSSPPRVLGWADDGGVPLGVRIKKKTELRDRLSRILARREEEGTVAADETQKLYDGALFLFAEAAKALWPRMDVRPIERAACFASWDERERYTELARRRLRGVVIGKVEDFSEYLNRETLAARPER